MLRLNNGLVFIACRPVCADQLAVTPRKMGVGAKVIFTKIVVEVVRRESIPKV